MWGGARRAIARPQFPVLGSFLSLKCRERSVSEIAVFAEVQHEVFAAWGGDGRGELFPRLIDIYEHISKESSGNVNIYVKVGFSKAMVQMAQSASSDSESSPTNWIDGIDQSMLSDDVRNLLNGKVAAIDTEREKGLSVQLWFKPGSAAVQAAIRNSAIAFIPDMQPDKMVFDFSGSGSSSNSQNEALSAMMDAFKYRLSISKTVFATISKVVVSTPVVDYKPQVVSLPDMFFIEIPLSQLFYATGSCQLIVYK